MSDPGWRTPPRAVQQGRRLSRCIVEVTSRSKRDRLFPAFEYLISAGSGDALDRCRRRVQQGMHGHRGRKDDPLYRARRTLHTGADLLTDKQTDRLTRLFADDTHVEVEATWGIYQRMIAAYRAPDRKQGQQLHGEPDRVREQGRPQDAHRDHHPGPDT